MEKRDELDPDSMLCLMLFGCRPHGEPFGPGFGSKWVEHSNRLPVVHGVQVMADESERKRLGNSQ